MNKILKTKQILLEDDVYPRTNVSWQTSARYYNALKSGAQFPAIVVAQEGNLLGTKYILIDGAHRLQAHKDNKEEHIQCEVLTGLTREQMYVESVKRNAQNGRQFSAQEVGMIIVKLEKLKISKEQISAIVHIPLGQLKSFVAGRMTRIIGGEDVILKQGFKHLAGQVGTQADIEDVQQIYTGNSQVRILDEVIRLIQNDLLDYKNALVKSRVKKLKLLVTDL